MEANTSSRVQAAAEDQPHTQLFTSIARLRRVGRTCALALSTLLAVVGMYYRQASLLLCSLVLLAAALSVKVVWTRNAPVAQPVEESNQQDKPLDPPKAGPSKRLPPTPAVVELSPAASALLDKLKLASGRAATAYKDAQSVISRLQEAQARLSDHAHDHTRLNKLRVNCAAAIAVLQHQASKLATVQQQIQTCMQAVREQGVVSGSQSDDVSAQVQQADSILTDLQSCDNQATAYMQVASYILQKTRASLDPKTDEDAHSSTGQLQLSYSP